MSCRQSSRGRVRVDLLVLGGMLFFGIGFVVLATYFGQDLRTRYARTPRSPLPAHLQVFTESLGTWDPLLPRLMPVPERNDGGSPIPDSFLKAMEILSKEQADPAPAVLLLSSATEHPWRHNLLVARLRAGTPASETVEGFREIALTWPSDEVAQYNLGLALLLSGKPHAAVTPLERAVEIDRTDGRAWFGLGLARERAGKLDTAAEAYGIASGILAGQADPPFRLARMAFDAKKFMQARDHAREAVTRAKDWPEAQRLFGQISIETKEFGQAKRAYRDVLQLLPDDKDASARVRWLDGVAE